MMRIIHRTRTNQLIARNLGNLKKKYCHLDNFVPEKESETETKVKTEKVNVGFLSNKQLKDKLEKIEVKTVPKGRKKKKQKWKCRD